jgi:hypothetical protein
MLDVKYLACHDGRYVGRHTYIHWDTPVVGTRTYNPKTIWILASIHMAGWIFQSDS